MEICQEPPKKVRYSIALYNQIGKKGFWKSVKKISKKLMRKDPEYYTKADLKDFLHHRNSTSASNFLQELEEDGILIEKGKRKGTETYDVDREKLLKEMMDTEYFDYYMGRKKMKFDEDIIPDIFFMREG